MRIANLAAAAAALTMVASPALAASQTANAPAAKVEPVRASTKLKKPSKAGAALIVPAVVLVGLGIAGVAGAFGDDDADSN